jgi:hypothetical protein
MHDIIELAHNVIVGEDHLIIQLLRDIDSRRSAASCSSGTDGDKSRPRSQRSPPPSSRHCFSAGTSNVRVLSGAEPVPGVGRPGRHRPWCLGRTE